MTTTTDLPVGPPRRACGVLEVASHQAGPAYCDPVQTPHGFPSRLPLGPHSEETIVDQDGLEGLDSFTLARIAEIEAKRNAAMPPMTPPLAPTPGGLREADQARVVQAAWEAGWNAGRSAGWQQAWDLRSAVAVIVWYMNSQVDL